MFYSHGVFLILCLTPNCLTQPFLYTFICYCKPILTDPTGSIAFFIRIPWPTQQNLTELLWEELNLEQLDFVVRSLIILQFWRRRSLLDQRWNIFIDLQPRPVAQDSTLLKLSNWEPSQKYIAWCQDLISTFQSTNARNCSFFFTWLFLWEQIFTVCLAIPFTSL